MGSSQSPMCSKLLGCFVIVSLCHHGNARRPYDRRREASPLIPSRHGTLRVATCLSGGALGDEGDSPNDLLSAMRVGNMVNRHAGSLANRASIKKVFLTSARHTKRLARYAPSLLSDAVLNRSDRTGLSLLSIYLLTLVGTSVGFHTFLYFLTVGYGTGIGIPVAISLIFNTKPIGLVAAIHAGLVLLWSMRMVLFLLWRERVNWPAFHKKLSQVNVQQPPDRMIKALCWIFYSLAYFCVASPCWFSIQTTGKNASGIMSWVGILLQCSGLVLETVADWQKSSFKASSPENRNRWCRNGLWKYSTHPNYAGEWIFWLGTLFVGMEAVQTDVTKKAWTKLLQTGIMTTGFGFIMTTFRVNVLNMDHRLEEKYVDQSEYDTSFVAFKQRYSVFGPRWWKDLSNGTANLTSCDRPNDPADYVAEAVSTNPKQNVIINNDRNIAL